MKLDIRFDNFGNEPLVESLESKVRFPSLERNFTCECQSAYCSSFKQNPGVINFVNVFSGQQWHPGGFIHSPAEESSRYQFLNRRLGGGPCHSVVICQLLLGERSTALKFTCKNPLANILSQGFNH